ncbi:MAG: hypothetical protein HC834_09010 [Rhodospirillales bacterium]|nr:hypothetical protein [Rhodospirillales bacterium]
MARDRDESVVWRQADGRPVACDEKLRVLNENLIELQQMAQDAFEDALLIGCAEDQVRLVLQDLVESLVNPYRGERVQNNGRD